MRKIRNETIGLFVSSLVNVTVAYVPATPKSAPEAPRETRDPSPRVARFPATPETRKVRMRGRGPVSLSRYLPKYQRPSMFQTMWRRYAWTKIAVISW